MALRTAAGIIMVVVGIVLLIANLWGWLYTFFCILYTCSSAFELILTNIIILILGLFLLIGGKYLIEFDRGKEKLKSLFSEKPSVI